ncbi:MAG: hypothetical protein ACI4EW_05610 [Butyrivibrio sp.]
MIKRIIPVGFIAAAFLLSACAHVEENEIDGMAIAKSVRTEQSSDAEENTLNIVWESEPDDKETEAPSETQEETEAETVNFVETDTVVTEVTESEETEPIPVETQGGTIPDIKITKGHINNTLTTGDETLIIDAEVSAPEIDTVNIYSYTYAQYDFMSIIRYTRPDIADKFVKYDASVMSPERYIANVYMDGEEISVEATNGLGGLAMETPAVVSSGNSYKAPASEKHASGCLENIDDCRKTAEDIRDRFYIGKWDSYEEKILPQDCVGNSYSKSGSYRYRYYCRYTADGLECFNYTNGGNVSDYFSVRIGNGQVQGFNFSTLILNKTGSGACMSVESAVSYLSSVIGIYKDWPLGTISEIKLQYITSDDEYPDKMIPCWVFYDKSFSGICFAVNAIDGSVSAFAYPLG